MTATITDEELRELERAAALADENVRQLLERDVSEGRFAPQLRTAGYIGTYVVPPIVSWETLDTVVADKSYDINFSLPQYPDFDGVIANHFRSEAFVDPLHKHYESWHSLRHNLAVVRNYLLIEYFEKNPQGLDEKVAESNLEKIAKYLGQGLQNNYLFFGEIPNHNPLLPFVDIHKAAEPNGEGARYIYERILQKDRQSNWLKPFNPVLEFFSGETVADWKLPELQNTPFYPGYEELITLDSVTDDIVMAALEESRRLQALLRDAYQMHDEQIYTKQAASDLDGLGNQLLFSAASAHQVAGLKEPVRRDAIAIAKDILEKLKLQLGGIHLKGGLNLTPEDDVTAVGAIKGVMLVYEKILGHARQIDPDILKHSAVVSATQAFGHIGYLAKLEALRFSNWIGDNAQSKMLSGQLQRVPDFFKQVPYPHFEDLIQHIETGFDTVLNRVQQVSGPSAFLKNAPFDMASESKQVPFAAMQAQVAAAIGVKSNAQAEQANQAANQSLQLKAMQLMRNQAQKATETGQAPPSAPRALGRAMLNAAKKAISSAQTSSTVSASSKAVQLQNQVNVQQRLANNARVANQRAAKLAAGIDPKVLQALRNARLNAARMEEDGQHAHGDHHHHDAGDHHLASLTGGLRPSATPAKTGAQVQGASQAHDAAPTTYAEAVDRQKHIQPAHNHATLGR